MLQTQHECIELNPSTLMVHLNNKIEKVQKKTKLISLPFECFLYLFFIWYHYFIPSNKVIIYNKDIVNFPWYFKILLEYKKNNDYKWFYIK